MKPEQAPTAYRWLQDGRCRTNGRTNVYVTAAKTGQLGRKINAINHRSSVGVLLIDMAFADPRTKALADGATHV